MIQVVGEYEEARKYHEKALALRKEIMDKNGVASSYGNIGFVYQLVGEYEKAIEYHENALALRKAIGDKKWRRK